MLMNKIAVIQMDYSALTTSYGTMIVLMQLGKHIMVRPRSD